MEYTTHYVVNPNYVLLNDIKRVLLINTSEREFDANIPCEAKVETFIHPLQAQMLAFFNGQDDLNTIIQLLSKHFDLEIEDVIQIIQKFIENPHSLSLNSTDQTIYFPKNILVPKNTVKTYREYHPTDFPFSGEVDFLSKRYYIPRNFAFVLSTKCYTNCIYCYADRTYKYNQKLSYDRIIQLVDEIETLGGCIRLDLSGGDILMDHDNVRFIKYIVSKGYQPGVSTKYPLSEVQVNLIADTGLEMLQISLDSSSPERIKELLQISNEDYYEKILRTISYFNQTHIKIRIHVILTSLNCETAALKILINNLAYFNCVKTIHFTPMFYSLFKRDAQNQRLKPHAVDLNEIYELIESYKRIYPNISFVMDLPMFLRQDYANPEKKLDLYRHRVRCSGNERSMVILPDGKVTVCEEMYWHPKFIIGDVTEQSIIEVWHSEKALKLHHFSQNDISEKSACKTCLDFNECRGEGQPICWKQVQYFYGRINWDFPYPSCEKAPTPIHNCLIE